jgi:hypothetical protein
MTACRTCSHLASTNSRASNYRRGDPEGVRLFEKWSNLSRICGPQTTEPAGIGLGSRFASKTDRRHYERMSSSKWIPLRDAPWAFASPRQRREWRRAHEPSNQTEKSGSYSALAQSLPDDPADAIKAVIQPLSDILEDIRIKSAPEWAAQESLVRKLIEGKYFEVRGVQSAPRQKRQLEVLPEHFFVDAKISWGENKVTNFGVTYSAVMVRRRSSGASLALAGRALKGPAVETPLISAAPSTEQDPEDTQRQKPGPVSGAEEVIAAYETLLREGVLNENMTVKTIYKKLHRILKQNKIVFPNERGLTYPSIARHILRYRREKSKFSR